MAEQVSNLLQYSQDPVPRNISGKLAVGFIVVTIPLTVSLFWVDYDRRPLIFLAAVACASSGFLWTRIQVAAVIGQD